MHLYTISAIIQWQIVSMQMIRIRTKNSNSRGKKTHNGRERGESAKIHFYFEKYPIVSILTVCHQMDVSQLHTQIEWIYQWIDGNWVHVSKFASVYVYFGCLFNEKKKSKLSTVVWATQKHTQTNILYSYATIVLQICHNSIETECKPFNYMAA